MGSGDYISAAGSRYVPVWILCGAETMYRSEDGEKDWRQDGEQGSCFPGLNGTWLQRVDIPFACKRL